jgi:predicted enzyme related to lactoylglutathione lyase
MSRVVHFELAADDPNRAAKFYTDVFGWKFHRWDGPGDYWLISTGEDEKPGINGGLSRRMQPSDFTTNTIDVANVDEAIARVMENGGTVIAPKMPIQGVGYIAYCRDTEGNTFGMIQSDPAAA